MKWLRLISLCALIATPLSAKPPIDEKARMAFRTAVADYQIFVIPICTPDIVHDYVSHRAERDQLFVKSLRSTELAADYNRAVADYAAKVRRTVHRPSDPMCRRLTHGSRISTVATSNLMSWSDFVTT